MGIREIIIEWLTATRYIKWLEARHYEQRQDFTVRMAEKDSIIREHKLTIAELSMECIRMRSVLMPLGSPAGQVYASRYGEQKKPAIVPAFDGPLDWRGEMQKMISQEESDGIHGKRRDENHQPRSDDGAQSQS